MSTPSSTLHLKTYTAGEDGSRLATLAKEFGLQAKREPRPQVRARTSYSQRLFAPLTQFVFDPTMEDARMRAIWSNTNNEDDDDNNNVLSRGTLLLRMNSSMSIGNIDDNIMDGDPHAHGLGGNLTSAVLGIIKGMVGPAILYLPHGFAVSGYAVALFIMFVATAMYLYSSQCLLQAWKHESTSSQQQEDDLILKEEGIDATESTRLVAKRSSSTTILSYPELARRALGPTGEVLVKGGIALMQFGVCLTYLIFVPHNLYTSINILFSNNNALAWMKPDHWLWVMVAIQIPLCWIRDIRKLTVTNFMANALILYGLLLCLGFAFIHIVGGQDDHHAQLDHGNNSTMPAPSATTTTGLPVSMALQEIWHRLLNLSPFESQWFLFIGTSVLLFEGSITLLVPLQESVQIPRQRRAFSSVYLRVILCIILFYAFFGIFCWMAFGNDVNVVLTTSLPSTNLWSPTVQLAYSLAVILTFPLQNFPALEIACASLLSTCHVSPNNDKLYLWKRNAIASTLVVLLALVAVSAMDSLDKVVSLMGSLLGCPIAFVFPPLIHSSLCRGGLSTGRLWTNRVVVVGGLVAMTLASIATIITW